MKGQQSIVAVTIIITAVTGFIFTSTADERIVAEIEHNNGDFNTIAKTKLKVEAYETRIPLELNYSGNIAAIRLGDNSGYSDDQGTWTAGNIPSYSSLKSNFESEIEDITRRQNDVLDCSSPSIDSVSTSHSSGVLNSDLSFGSANIVCTSEATVVDLPLDSNSITVENPDNRYLILAENSSSLAAGISGEFPSGWTDTGSGSKSCQDSISSTERQEAEQNAKDNARSSAINDANLASSLLNDYRSENSLANWISVTTDTAYSVSYTQQSSLTSDCEYDHDGHQVNCDDEGNNCETHEHDGEKYNTKYKATVNSAEVHYSLSDNARQVINSEGDMETLNFDFNYSESIGE